MNNFNLKYCIIIFCKVNLTNDIHLTCQEK